MSRWACSVVVALACTIACAPTVPEEVNGEGLSPGGDAGEVGVDQDGDGVRPGEGDCDDTDPDVSPNASDENCDGVDNDCDGIVDERFNLDHDPVSTCAGDCDDGDATVYPGAPELSDGKDNDCDDIVDNNRDDYDDDGDGFSETAGDCDDMEALVNPNAVEVQQIDDGMGVAVPEGVDNDCDGRIDEGQGVCDGALDADDPLDMAKAFDVCQWLIHATVTDSADSRARNIVGRFGDVYRPRRGQSMLVLSTGIAVDSHDPRFVTPNGGTPFDNTAPHPDPQPDPADGCGGPDPLTVNDYTELSLELLVPSNARSLLYDFNFMSGEFPEWVCSDFDDTFLAILESTSFRGNISFDENGRPVTINIGFFDVCATGHSPACTGDNELAGTGYEGIVGGATGWLTTVAPVTPGEIIRLRFVIFDEGDRAFDSLVLIDNFRWDAQGVDAPITVD